jgi:hypothetical protein
MVSRCLREGSIYKNADGVLLRKDGHPDMRSQSSAANSRRIHTTPSLSGYAADPDATDKHNATIGKIFTTGIDASRKQHDNTRQVFKENRDHTVHSRSQNHATNKAIEVKKEQMEGNRIGELQSPDDGDVDKEGQDGV